MDFSGRIEQTLENALAKAEADNAPPTIAKAMRHAVFPGGARVRPTLCMAVAAACGDEGSELVSAVAGSIELLHCASLVHDDLPCFDDAEIRREQPSVHSAFGEPLAVLAGDALIVLAYDTLLSAQTDSPERILALARAVTTGVGMPSGIVAGQAYESEPNFSAEVCRKSKTGALFVASTLSGAIACGADPEPWRRLGETVGEAYQVADDLLDAVSTAEQSDKPVGRDVALGRATAVTELGVKGARDRLEALVAEAMSAVPDSKGADGLRELVRLQAVRLVPASLGLSAA